MNSIYIREFDESDFQFYRECLSDMNWRKSYGEHEEPEILDRFIADRLKDYPFVKRYIFLSQDYRRVAFIVADFGHKNSKQCVMAGGVSVDLIGKGYGIKCSTIFCYYIFKNFTSIKNVIAYYQNESSKRMLLKIGFSKAKFNEIDQTQNKLALSTSDFPGYFCNKVLNRLGYVKN